MTGHDMTAQEERNEERRGEEGEERSARLEEERDRERRQRRGQRKKRRAREKEEKRFSPNPRCNTYIYQLKSHFPLKPKVLDLKFFNNANINMLISVSYKSLSGSLYDLQKPRSKVRPSVG